VTGTAAPMLPLKDTVLFAPRPEPLLAESGLAGGVVAVRRRDLEAVPGPDGTRVLVVKGAHPLPGDEVVWSTVAVVAPAVADADGRLAVGDWLPEHVRLGVLERHLGAGTVEEVVAASQARPLQPGEEPRQRRERLMSLPLVVRMLLAMTLLPNSSYVEVMAHVVGVLPRLPWARSWHVPSSTVFTEWRRLLGADAMRQVFGRVAGPIVAVTDPRGLWLGLRVCALDGFQVKVADSEANRAAFGSSGTSGGTGGPFPQVRVVVATARAGRALLDAVLGASRVGEMTLAWRLLRQRPDLFTPGHVYLLDRNFGSYEFLHTIHRQGKGAHFVVRMKSNVNLPVVTWLSDGEYLSYLRLRDGRCIKVRVVEYDVRKSDDTISELFCVATTLLDPATHPKLEIANVYHQRWSASETTIGESKSTITDAGPTRGPSLRPTTPMLVRQEIWTWLAAAQLVRLSAHAAAQTTTEVSTDQISFTTARREATRSMTQSAVTATSSPAALADAADRAARAALANLVTTDRDRHSPRAQKWRPTFSHTSTTKTTTRGPLTPTFGAILRPNTS
jgi:Transposase DDE domain/Insertion element 4 transposase N-terminal